ncbi:hypothetical protein [Hymenobacter cellulosilyticus]|uniref:Uncharacterized protein n=1 Tax=Hymenobacter cellulosilyticus TaxID=2932248 RepID=A0A8T9Q6C6_9BACT|nr:hypothetical protein [Hymenobacter cellulosilyticus]UOQ71548.1 hypothetical protein MUN79_23495 [Hymenobacter cellulosilyticus]
MEPLFQFRTAELLDNTQIQLHQQPGFLQATGLWKNAGSFVEFTDYFLDGVQMTTWKGQLQKPFQVELTVERPWLAMYFQLGGQVSTRACASRPLLIGEGSTT